MASDKHSYGTSAQSGFANPAAMSMSFDPAMLLNPRACAAGQPRTVGRGQHLPTPQNGLLGLPTRSHSSTSNTEFVFASPNDDTLSGTSTPSSVDTSAHATATPIHAFGSMIDRMNNIEERLSGPDAKRRKLSLMEDRAGMSQAHGRGSGAMADRLKDKREENVNRGRKATIDLTETIDDAVGALADPNEEEVCFGMIQDAKLNCHIVPSPKPGNVTQIVGWFPAVKIVLKRQHGDASNIVQAKDSTRQIVGRVDAATAIGLSPLLDAALKLRTDCQIPARRMQTGEIAGQATSTSYELWLMIYGPRRSGKTTARFLAKKKLKLLRPPRVEAGMKYENPQDAIEGPRLSAPPPQRPTLTQMPYTPAAVPRTVEEVRSEVMGVFDSLTKSEELPEMEADPRITTKLLPHQKQGLYFMMSKEKPRQFNEHGKTPNSFWQVHVGSAGQKTYQNVITGSGQREAPSETLGGILADMMGLGKTLSILALIASSLDEAHEWSALAPKQPQAPRSKSQSSVASFHVPAPQPLGLTRLVMNSKATLLVCPLSTITNWEEQMKTHTKPGALSYYVYHGSNRLKDVKKLAQFDVVVTTYGSVATEVTNRSRGRAGNYPLEEIGWFRVVLDEAHMIREQSTLNFKAICRLQASRRWAVTGTPIQNKLDDLAALLAFLRLKPFDDKAKFTQYIVAPFKVCDPEIVPKLRVLVDSVTLRRLKDKINLPPRTDEIVKLNFADSELKLYKMFEQNAVDKIQILSQGREKMGGKTYIHILQSILRLRLISAHGRDLLGDADLEIVQGMSEDSAIDLDSDNEDKARSDARAYQAFELMQETNTDHCYCCHRQVTSSDDNELEEKDTTIGYISACFHLLCRSCKPIWERDAGHQGSGDCPYCSTQIPFSLVELHQNKAHAEHDTAKPGKDRGTKKSNINVKDYKPHTKTRALLDDLMRSEADTKALRESDPEALPFKSVVFSGWTSHLDLIEVALDKAGIVYVRLDGKMSRAHRTEAMDRFRVDESVHVILVSIMAGGLGLNLTAGNSVYVMEPQYNPAAEAQAIDRVHRLGQTRPVRTVRYVMQDSIEETMLRLQEKKMALASLSMDRKVMDKADAAKQKLEDLRSLFR